MSARSDGRLSRRSVLAAAGATAAALAGCARPNAVLRGFGIGIPLHVHVIGLPGPQADGFITALTRCASAYARADRGLVDLTCTTSPIPDLSWYDCPSPGCPPWALPASTAAKPSAFDLVEGGGATEGQIGNGLAQFLVRGRTRLRVRFGGGQLFQPRLAPETTGRPDLIIAYDLWQYWLAPLAVDVSEQWKTATDDSAGLPSAFQRQARHFVEGRGTFVAAFPLLRSPMVLVSPPAATPWDWPHLVSAVTHYRGPFALQTTDFVQSPLYPEATELACALVTAYGGTVGTTTTDGTAPAFSSAQAAAALSDLAAIAGAGPAGTTNGIHPLYLTYLWSPLAGVRHLFQYPFGPRGFAFQPLPPGPARAAVPCTYLAATVVATGRYVPQAQDFAGFLMNPRSQAELTAPTVGLALRTTDALAQTAALFPLLTRSAAEALASSDNDLVAAEVYGGDETDANASGYDGIADRFAVAFSEAEAHPARVAAILQQSATGG